MKKILKSPVIWLVIILSLPLWALMVPGLPFTHDGPDHVARIANFYLSLTEGNFVPRWAGNLNWGYGHPILMFLYPFPSYAASVFHSIGFSLVDSVKLVFGLSFVFSGVAMYLWMRDEFGESAGLIGALLYTFAPYRFVDLYVRGALGEHVAFIFPPLILYCIKHLGSAKNLRSLIPYFIGASLSIAGLILSHNAIALMFIPIVVLYLLYSFYGIREKRVVLCSVFSVVLGFTFSAFFWIPAFFEGKYTLRNIVTAGEALQRFVPWSWFIYSQWNFGGGVNLTKFLGFTQWAGIAASIVFFAKVQDKRMKILIAGLWIVLAGSLYIMTEGSGWIWRAFIVLQNFQFPWRFLSVSVFISAVIGGITLSWSVSEIHKRYKLKNNIISVILYVGIIAVTMGMWHPKGYVHKNESYYTGIYLSTTDTGESSPIWSVRFMEHKPETANAIISGDATIRIKEKTTTRHVYAISVRKPTRILENTLYFPGWNVYVDNVKTGIQFQDPEYRGLITYELSEGNHTVVIMFENTLVRKFAGYITIASILLTFGFSGTYFIWKKNT